jgi:hypothetical protein
MPLGMDIALVLACWVVEGKQIPSPIIKRKENRPGWRAEALDLDTAQF